jgi:hypothetical protein
MLLNQNELAWHLGILQEKLSKNKDRQKFNEGLSSKNMQRALKGKSALKSKPTETEIEIFAKEAKDIYRKAYSLGYKEANQMWQDEV